MFSRVLVAVDVFSEDSRLIPGRVMDVVAKFLPREGARVEAAYVLTPKAVAIPAREFPEWQEFYKRAAGTVLAQVVSGLPSHAVGETKVLPSGRHSVTDRVDALLAHAQRSGADVIALSSHAREGVDRFFLGSFAETLLLRSPIPVLVVNPAVEGHGARQAILLPLSLESDEREERAAVAELASRIGAKVILYHVQELPFPVLPPPGFMAEATLESETRRSVGRLNEYRAEMLARGVEVETKSEIVGKSVSDTICRAAKSTGCSLIALSARANRRGILPLGSATRQVVRRAECPVLILTRSREGEEDVITNVPRPA